MLSPQEDTAMARYDRYRSRVPMRRREVRSTLIVDKADIPIVAEQINAWAGTLPPRSWTKVDALRRLPGDRVEISLMTGLLVPAVR